MAKKKSVFGKVVIYEKKYKGTKIGKKPITSTMNKSERKGRSRKQIKRARSRGQGKPI